jgi:hypothetical protein
MWKQQKGISSKSKGTITITPNVFQKLYDPIKANLSYCHTLTMSILFLT